MSHVVSSLIGAKGGGGSSFKTKPDTLRSKDSFEILLGLGSGRWKGLTNGLKSLYINDVPLHNDDGEANFENFSVLFADGDPTQTQHVNFKLGGGGGTTGVNVPIANSWVTAAVTTPGADFIDIRLMIAALYRQDKEGIGPTTMTLELEMRPSGAAEWINPLGPNTPPPDYDPDVGVVVDDGFGGMLKLVIGSDLFARGAGGEIDYGNWADDNPGYITIKDKTTSPSIKEIRIAVPNTGDYANKTWEVRLRMIENPLVQNDPVEERRTVTFESIAAITKQVFGDDEAWRGLVWLQAVGKASDQLNGFPRVRGIFDRKIVKVPPSNVFNVDTRQYSGALWDGSYVTSYTNDPAWCIKDLIEDPISGIAALSPGASLDKWDALEASKYYSELVPDGRGGTHPRFSMNASFEQAMDAEDLIQYMAGAVNSLAVDVGNSKWRLKVDKPENPVAIFTTENIVGEFQYSHTDIDSRFNDYTCAFLNAERNYEEDRVRVWDQEHIDTYGRKPTSIVAIGADSRQEALRRAMFRLRVSLNETRMVKFITNRQGKLIQPLDTILVADTSLGYTAPTNAPDWNSITGLNILGASGTMIDLGIDMTKQAPDGTMGVRKISVVGNTPDTTALRYLGDRAGHSTGTAGEPVAGSLYFARVDGQSDPFNLQINDNGKSGQTVDGELKLFEHTYTHPTQPYRFMDLESLKDGEYYIWGLQIVDGTSTPDIADADVTDNRTTGRIVKRRRNHLYNSAGVGAVAGYLEARTNHFMWSQKIQNSVWQKTGMSAVVDDYATAPDGSLTASRLVPSTSTTNHYILQNLSVTAGLYYTDSFRAKADGYTWVQVTPSTGFDPVGDYVNVNLLDGSIGNSSTTNGLKVTVEALEDGWYEIRATALCTVTAVSGRFLVAPIDSNRAGRNPSWAGNDTDGILVWGRQFEQAATATDYIPTTTAAVTAPATGAVPTGWLWGAVPGLVRRVLGSGVDAQGRKFTDFHVQGTNTHSSTGYAHLNVGRAEQATTGETWTFSGGVEDILGTTKAGFSNAVGTIEWQELRSSGNYLTGTTQVLTRDGVRRSVQRTLTHTEAVKVQAVVNGSIMPGSSVNWAFRVYEPMLEKETEATAYIETTNGPADAVDLRDTVRLEPSVNYEIAVTVPNPDYDPDSVTQPTTEDNEKPTITITRAVTNTNDQRGDVTTLYLDSALPDNVPENAPIALSAVGLPTLPVQYRVLEVTPSAGEEVQISALIVDTGKWAAMDNVSEDDLNDQTADPYIAPPTDLNISLVGFNSNYQYRRVLTATWARPATLWLEGFKVEYRVNYGQWILMADNTTDNYFELQDPENGTYDIRITAKDRRGMVSNPLIGEFIVTDINTNYHTRGPLVDRPILGMFLNERYTSTDTTPNVTYLWNGANWLEESSLVITGPDIGVDAGATRNINRGNWASGLNYAYGDIFQWEGSSYWVNTSHTSSGTSPDFTKAGLLAAQGETGATGGSGIVGFLTNESHIVPASSTGVISSMAGAVTDFKVYEGTQDISTNFTITAPINAQGVGVAISGRTVTFSVGTWPSGTDVATVTLRATGSGTYSGITIDKVVTLTKSKQGSTGTNAKLVSLVSDRQVIYFNTAGSADPATQTTTFTVNRQNTTAAVTWTMKNAAGTDVVVSSSTLTVASDGLSATMTVAQFNAARGATTGVIVTATCDGLSDRINVMRVAQGATGPQGAAALTGYLTNETHTVATASDGTGGNFSGAGGTFKVLDGFDEITTGNGIVYSVVSETGVDVSINASTGVYSVASMSADQGMAVFQAQLPALYGSLLIQKTYSITKSKAGTDGAASKMIKLLTDRQTIYVNTAGTAEPPVQTVNLSVQKQNTSAAVVWSITKIDGTAAGGSITASGDTATMTVAQFNTARGTSNGVIITATCDGLVEKVSIVRVAQGATGAQGSNSAAILIYRRSATANPPLPTASTTYTFASGELTGLNNGWATTIPATDGNPLYVSRAVASAATATDTIAASEWAAPVVALQDGVAGLNQATVYLYQRKATNPGAPTSAVTYVFADGSISAPGNGWAGAIPAGTDPIWVIHASAISSGSSDTIATSEWSTPQILAQNGLQGEQGIQGPVGPQGATTYTWIAYANDATGTSGFTTGAWSGQTYIGLANNKLTATESTDPADYTWSKIQGDQGVPGTPGANGVTTYTWFAYANDATGSTGFTTGNWTNQTYIGIATNKTTATESTDPADYTWSKIQGPQGPAGAAAKSIRMTADRQIVTFDGDGVQSPASQDMTLTVHKQNTSAATTFTYADNLGTASATLEAYTNSAPNGRIVLDDIFDGVPSRLWVKVTATVTDGDTLTDTVTLHRLDAGTDALTVVMSNEAHTLPSAATNNTVTDWSGAAGNIRVFAGAADVTSLFTIATASNPQAVTMAYDNTANPRTYTASDAPTVSGQFNNASVNVATITIRATGSGVYAGKTLDKVFTLTKSRVGTTGAPGADAKVIKIAASHQSFSFDKDGNAKSQTSTFVASRQNTTVATIWTFKDAAGTWLASGTAADIVATGYFTSSNNDTLTMTEAQFKSYYDGAPATRFQFSLEATFTDGSVTSTDKMSVVRLQDGQHGLAGYLTNENHSVPCDSAGNPITYSGAEGEFRVMLGTTDVTANCTFARGTATGISTASMNGPSGATGYYNFTSGALTADVGTVVVTATHTPTGKTVSKTITLVKAKQGIQGPQGEQGVQGPPGANGTTYYTWIAYADSPDGTVNFTTGAPGTRRYIGVATGKTTATESTTASDYTWSQMGGFNGEAPWRIQLNPYMTRSGAVITKSTGAAGWTGAFFSNEKQLGAAVSFSPNQTNGHVFVGFNTSPSNQNGDYTTQEYAWYCNANGTMEIWESNTNRGFFGVYATTDVFQIIHAGTNVLYLKNGVVIRVVTGVSASMQMYLDSSVYTVGASITMHTPILEDAIIVTASPAAVNIALNADGSVKTGQLPKSITVSAKKAGATVSITSMTGITKQNCSASVAGSVISITAITSTEGYILYDVVVEGQTHSVRVPYSTTKDGSSGSVSATKAVTVTAVSSTTVAGTALSGTLVMNASSTGKLKMSGDAQYVKDGTGFGTFVLDFYVQYRAVGSGTWVSAGSITGTSSTWDAETSTNVQGGAVVAPVTITGLTAGGAYEMRLAGNKNSGGSTVNGTVQAGGLYAEQVT